MKRKIYFIAVLLIVGLLMPSLSWGNVFTERRSYFIGGHAGFFNYDWKYTDESFKYKSSTFTIDVSNGWFLNDNFAVGLKLGYGYTKDDDVITTDNIDYTTVYTTRTFRLGLFTRNYIGLTKRISLFVETSAVGGFGGIKTENSTDLLLTSTSSGNHFSLEVGLRPGIAFFFNNGFSVEATVGFIGFTYQKQKTGDLAIDTESSTTGLDFSMKVDQLRIQVGAALYL